MVSHQSAFKILQTDKCPLTRPSGTLSPADSGGAAGAKGHVARTIGVCPRFYRNLIAQQGEPPDDGFRAGYLRWERREIGLCKIQPRSEVNSDGGELLQVAIRLAASDSSFTSAATGQKQSSSAQNCQGASGRLRN